MDMHEPYVQAALAKVLDAAQKIVFDLYHIMQNMGLNKVDGSLS